MTIRDNYNEAKFPFLLSRFLLYASVASLDDVFILLKWSNSDDWISDRARGPIGFLKNFTWNLYSLYPKMILSESSTIALIEFFSRIGFELGSPVQYYTKGYKYFLKKNNNLSCLFFYSIGYAR